MDGNDGLKKASGNSQVPLNLGLCFINELNAPRIVRIAQGIELIFDKSPIQLLFPNLGPFLVPYLIHHDHHCNDSQETHECIDFNDPIDLRISFLLSPPHT